MKSPKLPSAPAEIFVTLAVYSAPTNGNLDRLLATVKRSVHTGQVWHRVSGLWHHDRRVTERLTAPQELHFLPSPSVGELHFGHAGWPAIS